ncbi:MAG TPA: UDP-N-acetylmuramoyl-tripeptide--D-alanyl-D-alanine ligase [Polyangiaceae bacterium]|nr:UDP-N-acetylmuramoyl-tripeptide--D-alanyl-D-alanine ligase [Polyangiaceae bacterium]
MSTQTMPTNAAAFTLDEVVQVTAGQLLYHGAEQANSVTTDTRTLKLGALFVALVGERFDAHHFLDQACKSGATILVVQDVPQAQSLVELLGRTTKAPHPSIVLVQDTLRALGDLACAHRARHGAQLVAVVGSAGKTTTRSVISALLEEAVGDRVHSTLSNFNNRIGVPVTLFGLQPHHAFAVLELGTNERGEIAELARIAQPNLAVLTLIDLEHTEGLGDLDGVEAEERAVFDYLPSSGKAIGYGDDPRVLRSVVGAACQQHLTYGELPERDVRIVDRHVIAPDESEVSLQRLDQSRLSISSPLVGRAGALAVAAGVTVVEALLERRLTRDECERALRRAGEPGRHTIVHLAGGRVVLDDSYNSNPASVENSIRTGVEIAQLTGGRLWLVLGEMLELGALTVEAHQHMGEAIDPAQVAGVFFVQGAAIYAKNACRSGIEVCEFVEKSEQVVAQLSPRLGPLDVVVVKASRGVRAERVVEGLVAHFGREPAAQNALSNPSYRQT